jgi:epoxyqueuosine reductase QueG
LDQSFFDDILPYNFVFAVEMDMPYISKAPFIPESIAVTKGYVDAAIIGMIVTYYIKSLGYEARNHMDGNYLMVMPLAAKAAGFGDIGRHGLLITPEYGPRIRLGAVTTSMPLVPDAISEFNVKEFCYLCGKCALSDPIEKGEINKYIADPNYAHEILKQFNSKKTPQKMDNSDLNWLK